MTVFEILREAIERGIEHDFRPRSEVLSYYWKETIESPGGGSFENPYADTGVVYAANLDLPVRRIAAGIDVGQAEILSIHEWQEDMKKPVDCFVSHHPRGKILGSFPHILKTQIGNLEALGVSMKGMEHSYDKQFKEDQEEMRDMNIYRTKNTIELLGLNYISLHTPLDNMGARFVESWIAKSRAKTLEECEHALMEIPEYRMFFEESGIKPVSHVGKGSSPLGRCILSEFTGGEDGPIEIYQRMKKSGVSTIIVMHIDEKALRAARKVHLNVISAGHITSDAIGLNLFCDVLEKKGIEVVPIGGFIRHRRG